MNFRIIGALMLRHIYVNMRTPLRFFELLFWPMMDLLLWGFLTVHLRSTVPEAMRASMSFLLGGIILWDIMFRCQQGVAISFLEDVWRRNLLNVFVAPVRMPEYIIAGFGVGFVRICITGGVMTLTAWLGYQFNLIDATQIWLVPFFINAVFFGWVLGMFTMTFLFRWGHAAEVLAWAVPFFIQPIAAVFYPVSALPVWLRPLSQMLPISHVFEAMRELVAGHQPSWSSMFLAFGLNLFYMVLVSIFFAFMLRSVRERGLLAKVASS